MIVSEQASLEMQQNNYKTRLEGDEVEHAERHKSLFKQAFEKGHI